MKKTRKKLIAIMLLFIFVVSGIGFVYATGTDGGGTGNTIKPDLSGTTDTGWYGRNFNGVRLSLVNSNGDTIASKNYGNPNIKELNANEVTFLVSENKFSKPSYIKKGITDISTKTTKLVNYLNPLENFSSFFSVTYHDKNGNLKKFNFLNHNEIKEIINPASEINGNLQLSYENLIQKLNRNKIFKPLTEEQYEECITNFFNKIIKNLVGEGKTLNSYLTKDGKAYDLFIVMEPTIALYFNTNNTYSYENENDNFYGTFYESVLFARKLHPTSSNNWMPSLLNNWIPCSLHLDGNISNLTNKLGVFKDTFKANDGYKTYFGNIQISTRFPDGANFSDSYFNDYNYCKKWNYSEYNPRWEIVTGPNGLGMGVVWPNSLIDTPDEEKLTCDIVNKELGLPEDNYKGDANDLKDQFKKFNEKYKDKYDVEIDANWYKTNCPWNDTNDNRYSCSNSINFNNCLDEQQISYSDLPYNKLGDMEYWNKCIFSTEGNYPSGVTHKSPLKGQNLSYYEPRLGDEDYCPVYCVENVNTNFPFSPYGSVMSGRYFIWGNLHENTNKIEVGSIEGTRICRTKTIDWKKFEKDLAEYNKNSLDKYNKMISYKEGTTEYSNAEKAYKKAVSATKGIVSKMEKCYKNWDEKNIYNVNPTVRVNFDDSYYYKYNDELKTETIYSEIDKNENCNSEDESVRIYKENNKYDVVKIKKCSDIIHTRSAKTNLSMPEGVYQYVLKEKQKSIHANQIGNYENNYLIDIGFSNFPISFKANIGWYGINQENGGNLDLNYKNLGHIISSESDVDKIFNRDYSENYHNWQCKYHVSVPKNDTPDKCDPNVEVCEPDKPNIPNKPGNDAIKVVYREIDLKNPFPDIDGSGRNTGSNWCYKGNCKNDNEVVKSFILNNRGYKDFELYSHEPMYSIILTPKAINEIRRYNKESSYTEYENSYFDFKCDGTTGNKCISGYLTHLFEYLGSNGYYPTGTCVNGRNDKDNFDLCRYENVDLNNNPGFKPIINFRPTIPEIGLPVERPEYSKK